MKLFRITTKVEGSREPFVDWFEAESEGHALMKWAREAQSSGVPLHKATKEVVECDPQSLKPI